jgi:condensin complex subunit 1
MEVDEEDDEEEEDDDDDEEEDPNKPSEADENGDVEMVDAASTPKKSKKKSKKKGRKSEIDMAALTSEQAALAALEGNELLSLKLRKKYYSEGLNFIRQIEGAIPIAGQLLGSTNKAEVLEAMEFFRVIHIYHFDGADVRLPVSVAKHHPYVFSSSELRK